MAVLTSSHARSRLAYDPATGVFTHVETRGRAKAGERADFSNGKRYRQVAIDRVCYSAHRMAWLLTHGVWPNGQIDHINGDIFDNRLANLRDANASQNTFNRRNLRRPAELRGIQPVGNRWSARIGKDNKYIHIGYYDTPEEAREAYVAAATRMFREFVPAEMGA